MADYRIDSTNHLFSGAPDNMPSTTYAAGRNLPNRNSYSGQVKVQSSKSTVSPYPPNQPANRRDFIKNESAKRAKIRREAIKSDNFKDPVVVCPVCKMKLSPETEECPNCSHKMIKKMSDNKKTLILIIIAILILFIPFIKKSEFDGSKFENNLNSFFSEVENAFNSFMEDETDYEEDFWEDGFFFEDFEDDFFF